MLTSVAYRVLQSSRTDSPGRTVMGQAVNFAVGIGGGKGGLERPNRDNLFLACAKVQDSGYRKRQPRVPQANVPQATRVHTLPAII